MIYGQPLKICACTETIRPLALHHTHRTIFWLLGIYQRKGSNITGQKLVEIYRGYKERGYREI